MADQIKDGGPAFPGGVNSVYTSIEEGEPTQPGMSLRDYFAAKALQGLLASETSGTAAEFAAMAFKLADAMLHAREVSHG